jgi:hypothetical protein
MINPTLAAARKAAADLRDLANELDAYLAAFERAEAQGEAALPVLTGAQVLVALDGIGDALREQVEVLDGFAEDLPAASHHHDGAADARDR